MILTALRAIENHAGKITVAVTASIMVIVSYDAALARSIDANFRGINETACQAHATRVAQENWLRGR